MAARSRATPPSKKRAAAPPSKKAGAAPAEKPKAAPEAKAEFIVVGVGASAGGFEAVVELLRHLPEDTGMAFVLVQHLDPTHESKLTELLSHATTMPVVEVRDGMRVEPNRVHVMPPNTKMALQDDVLRLLPRRKVEGPHMPIDFFFRSLGESRHGRAIGIVLSGIGTDGTLGLQAIKAEGGITLAQDEKSAKYPGMPSSAIAAKCVDTVLPPAGIAAELARIALHPYAAPAKGTVVDKLMAEATDELTRIFVLVRMATGVDFACYKHSTLKRRIVRRMVLHKIQRLEDYVRYLQANPPEVQDLFEDLLINVTSFFRDPQVFRMLRRRILPKILKAKSAGDEPIRIWVPGCSTGEEVYSLAISLVEAMEDANQRPHVQIFGTDISEITLAKARAGIYPENIKGDVSAERLRRWFVKSNGYYQVGKTIRDLCVFARQNVCVDPPFSRLDLISCRNLLIYLGPALQKKVLPIFHYALNRGGYLLLGTSETIGGFADLFNLVDKKNKVYTKKVTAIPPEVTFSRDAAGWELPELTPLTPRAGAEPRLADVEKQADRIALSRFAPGGVVVNEGMDVLQFRGRTGLFLEHAPGSASLSLFRMARPDLMVDLRAALSAAAKKDVPIRRECTSARVDGKVVNATIDVVPFRVPPANERFFLVVFDERRPETARGAEKPGRARSKGVATVDQKEISRLRDELANTKESLQAIIEEQEATMEELKSANEEIQSSNEELQSTNEELETAKEELQSTNEELTTLNEELQNRNTELTQLNNDLSNLLGSVNIPILMLGNDLAIRRFTPQAEKLFNLIPSDVGRRFSDIRPNLEFGNLEPVIHGVIDTLNVAEREVQDRSGHWYLLRIRPYRTRENRIDGVVVALLDIDELKRSLDLIDMIEQPVVILYGDLRVKRANPPFYRIFRCTPEQAEHQVLFDICGGLWNTASLHALLEQLLPKSGEVKGFKAEQALPDGGKRTVYLNARRVLREDRGAEMILLTIAETASAE